MGTLRLIRILFVAWRFGLDEIAAQGAAATLGSRWLLAFARLLRLGRRLDAPRGERLRRTLESLGPIFVKFGQVLSTRRDLLPTDIADELARLQDRVPPFPGESAVREIEAGLGRPVDEIFDDFNRVMIHNYFVSEFIDVILSVKRFLKCGGLGFIVFINHYAAVY